VTSFALIVAVGLSSQSTPAATLNYVDTFQSGTTLNWVGQSSPTNISTGGPGGETDRFLQISTDGFHLATFNAVLPWTGDYTAAGIKAIEMDLNQLGAVDDDPVGIRLYVLGAGSQVFASTVSKPIARGEWRRYQFGLTAADLTDVGGGGNLAATLGAVAKVLIRYNVATIPTGPGNQDSITAALGIDNIRGIIPGDVNYNGFVDIFDINLVSSTWMGPGPTADANADYTVDIFDINLISSNWMPPAAGAPVPEPAALFLATVGVIGCLRLVRQRKVRS
jgi:hypothetical protein